MGGITAILSVIALVGFVGLILGIGVAVVSSSQGRSARGGVFLAVIGLVIGLAFTLISQGVVFVDVTQVGVVTNTLTGQLGTPLRSGTHIIIPGVQVVTLYPINQQDYTMSSINDEGVRQGNDAVDTTTSDGQPVGIDVTVFYAISPEPDKINTFHTRWGNNYGNYIRSTARRIIRDVVALFRADDLYGADRTLMSQQVNDQMRVALDGEGFILNRVDIRGLQFSATFLAAIEAKIAADQAAQQAAFVVQQRQQEADQARAVAAGQADAQLAIAGADAQAIVLRAQAQAQALQLVSQQLAANPLLIQYLYVQNLSDNVNVVLLPSNSPFLFDLSGVVPDNTFVPPAAPTTPPATPTTP